jgi:hypothetical protein
MNPAVLDEGSPEESLLHKAYESDACTHRAKKALRPINLVGEDANNDSVR